MHQVLAATALLAGVTAVTIGIFVVLIVLFFAVVGVVTSFLHYKKRLALKRSLNNPIISPIESHWWESEAVFNPAALVYGGKVHLLYRALGQDGVSRIGYASSEDGIHFNERLPHPIYSPSREIGIPGSSRVYGPLSYDTHTYASGGGWAGVEDPRVVTIDGSIYMTFVAFDGWGFVRMALTAIGDKNFRGKIWKWRQPVLLSPPGEIHKNWVLFPEKIKGKYAILHTISPDVEIEYVKDPEEFDGKKFIKSRYSRSGRKGFWDSWVRGAGPPPLKTKYGWILLYHAMDEYDPNKYKLGAMMLDLEDPTKVLYRSSEPILSPQEWYENDGKPGVVYSCGAVILGDDLIVYYGAGDKRIGVAKTDINDFVGHLMRHEHATLSVVVK
jgi:predicted GH43/DUF377 family glycosyl hydrolase